MEQTNLRPSNNRRHPSQFPPISLPTIIGAFSVYDKRQYHSDRTMCKYVYPECIELSRVQYDLNDGMANVIRKPENCSEHERIDHLLRFILSSFENVRKTQNNDKSKLLSADVVCFRGMLRLLMCTPYENRDAWIILATKYKGTIYLCAKETDAKMRENANLSQKTKTIFSYGFKFEQYLFTGKFTLNFCVHFFVFIEFHGLNRNFLHIHHR